MEPEKEKQVNYTLVILDGNDDFSWQQRTNVFVASMNRIKEQAALFPIFGDHRWSFQFTYEYHSHSLALTVLDQEIFVS